MKWVPQHSRIAVEFILFAILLSGLPALTAGRRAEKAAPERSTNPFAQAVVQLVAVGPVGRGKNEECTATGFFVNDRGYILTNAHVVEEARRCLEGAPGAKILAKFAGPDPNTAEAIPCNMVGLDEIHDLAVLQAERLPAAVSRSERAHVGASDIGGGYLILDPRDVAVGERVAVTGHTGRTWHAVTSEGSVIVCKSLILLESSAESSNVIVLDIPLKRGASGSPVYLKSGHVIGVVVETDPDNPERTVAVATSHAIRLLDRLRVPYRTPSGPMN